MGVAPHEAIHVGDSLWADGEGARNAGLAGFVLMLDGRPRPEGYEGASIGKLGELPKMLGLSVVN